MIDELTYEVRKKFKDTLYVSCSREWYDNKDFCYGFRYEWEMQYPDLCLINILGSKLCIDCLKTAAIQIPNHLAECKIKYKEYIDSIEEYREEVIYAHMGIKYINLQKKEQSCK